MENRISKAKLDELIRGVAREIVEGMGDNEYIEGLMPDDLSDDQVDQFQDNLYDLLKIAQDAALKALDQASIQTGIIGTHSKMTKAQAEQILINEGFNTNRGKKAVLARLASYGCWILNEKYLDLVEGHFEIRIDNRAGHLVLKAF